MSGFVFETWRRERDSNPRRLITSAVFKVTVVIFGPPTFTSELADCGYLREAATRLRLSGSVFLWLVYDEVEIRDGVPLVLFRAPWSWVGYNPE